MKLRYTIPAHADLNSVLDYIEAHSPQGARRVKARIQEITDLLLLYPTMGTRTDDPAIRRMTASPILTWSFTKQPRTSLSFTPYVMQPATLPACRARADSGCCLGEAGPT